MPSAAAESLLSMVDAVHDTFGVAATYTNRAAVDTAVSVVVDRNLGRYGGTVQISAGSVVISVRKSEVSQVPLRGETFLTEDGDTYVVDSPFASNELEHRVLARPTA